MIANEEHAKRQKEAEMKNKLKKAWMKQMERK